MKCSRLLFLPRRRRLSSSPSAGNANADADAATEIAALLAPGKYRDSATRAQEFLRSNRLPADAAAAEIPNFYRAIVPAPAEERASYLSAAASARAPLPGGALRLLSHLADTPQAPLPSASSRSLLPRRLLALGLGRHSDVRRRVFGTLAPRGEGMGTCACHAAVKACVASGDLDEAVRRIRGMGRDGAPRPGASIYNTVLNALWGAGRPGNAAKVFDEMADAGVAPDKSTYNAMFDGYRKSGDLEAAAEVLLRMSQEGFKLSKGRRCHMPRIMLALWRNGRGAEALKLFGEMAGMGVEPEKHTYTAMIDGFVKSGDFEAASKVLQLMWRVGIVLGQDRYLMFPVRGHRQKWNRVINHCIMFGDIDETVGRLRRLGHDGALRPNAWSYTMVITTLWKARRGDEAVKLFGEMADMAVAPDFCTYSAMIVGHLLRKSATVMSSGRSKRASTNEDLDAALELRARMVQDGFKPNEFTNVLMARELKLAGRIEDVAALFRQMLAQGTPLSEIMETGLAPFLFTLDEDLLMGVVEESLKKAGEMEEKDCITLLGGICVAGDASTAARILGTLAKAEVILTTPMCNTLIHRFCRDGDLDRAFFLCREMRSQQLAPDHGTYHALLMGLCKNPRMAEWKDVAEELEKNGLITETLASSSQTMDTLKLLYEDLLQFESFFAEPVDRG